MSLVAIDPGKHLLGWAVFDNAVLTRCGLMGVDAHHMARSFEKYRDGTAVIEAPQIYNQRHWKGDPNDLVDVAIVAGMTAGFLRHCDIEYVRPHSWKGSRPKEIHNRYILSQLDQDELELIDACGVVKSKRHNVIDAVGIGLWKLDRA